MFCERLYSGRDEQSHPTIYWLLYAFCGVQDQRLFVLVSR